MFNRKVIKDIFIILFNIWWNLIELQVYEWDYIATGTAHFGELLGRTRSRPQSTTSLQVQTLTFWSAVCLLKSAHFCIFKGTFWLDMLGIRVAPFDGPWFVRNSPFFTFDLEFLNEVHSSRPLHTIVYLITIFWDNGWLVSKVSIYCNCPTLWYCNCHSHKTLAVRKVLVFTGLVFFKTPFKSLSANHQCLKFQNILQSYGKS